jgi:hypothetical protein
MVMKRRNQEMADMKYYVVNETEQRVSQMVDRQTAEAIAHDLAKRTGRTYTIRQAASGVAVAVITAQS